MAPTLKTGCAYTDFTPWTTICLYCFGGKLQARSKVKSLSSPIPNNKECGKKTFKKPWLKSICFILLRKWMFFKKCFWDELRLKLSKLLLSFGKRIKDNQLWWPKVVPFYWGASCGLWTTKWFVYDFYMRFILPINGPLQRWITYPLHD